MPWPVTAMIVLFGISFILCFIGYFVYGKKKRT